MGSLGALKASGGDPWWANGPSWGVRGSSLAAYFLVSGGLGGVTETIRGVLENVKKQLVFTLFLRVGWALDGPWWLPWGFLGAFGRCFGWSSACLVSVRRVRVSSLETHARVSGGLGRVPKRIRSVFSVFESVKKQMVFVLFLHVGRVLGGPWWVSWASLGALGTSLGVHWCVLGDALALLGRSLGLLGRPRRLLGVAWGVLGGPCPLLTGSWGVLGRPWGVLGGSPGCFKGPLGLLWASAELSCGGFEVLGYPLRTSTSCLIYHVYRRTQPLKWLYISTRMASQKLSTSAFESSWRDLQLLKNPKPT